VTWAVFGASAATLAWSELREPTESPRLISLVAALVLMYSIVILAVESSL
jgi:hypothetical protein